MDNIEDVEIEDKEEDSSSLYRFHSQMLSLDYDFSLELQAKLQEHHIYTSLDLANLTDEQLSSNRYGFSPALVQEVQTKFRERKFEVQIKGFFDPSLEEQFITTGSRRFDEALGGKGIPVGKITQISGTAGAGKTQFCHRLCLTVQLDPSAGGVNGEALYWNVEDCFRPERISEMAHAMGIIDYNFSRIHHFHHISTDNQWHEYNRKDEDAEGFMKSLQGVHLENYLKEHPNIRLFIIDSVTYHFRFDYQATEWEQLQHFLAVGKRLKYLASKYNLAIVMTNQVKQSPVEENSQEGMWGSPQKMEELPAMGEFWNSIPSTAIQLTRPSESPRFATILKSLYEVFEDKKPCFEYKIGKSGLEEFTEEDKAANDALNARIAEEKLKKEQ